MRVVLATVLLCSFAACARAEIIDRREHLGWRAAHASRQEIASCYGREHGQTRTALGTAYEPWRLTAAHRTLPFGTRVLVSNRRNGRAVVVTINDRGPSAWTHRAIDLSLGACRAIRNSGVAPVLLQIIGGPHEARSRNRSRWHARRRR
jgi:rare lipoprotein A